MKQHLHKWSTLLALLIGIAAFEPALLAGKLSTPPAKVSINAAAAEQLATLPGVGPETAKRIVSLREKSGPFKRLEDLMTVKGIGEKKFKRLREWLTL